MYRAEFEVETITPLFMRGANQSKAEFRPASVKGVMRWWFRTLAGRYFGDNITKLREAECRVFGCAGSGETRRSSVIVKAELVESNDRYASENRYENYFWFSQVGRYAKGAILPGARLSLTLESHDENSLKLAVLSLWAALHLGGFGSRSRKFAGSLFPVSEPDLDVDVGFSFVPSGNIEKFYREILNERLFSELPVPLRELGFNSGTPYRGIPEYPVLDENHSIVAVGDAKRSVSEVIEQVGRWYLGNPDRRGKFSGGFRFRHADRRIPHRIYQKYRERKRIGSISATSERRPFLGLPIQFYKSFGEEAVKFTVDHWNADRRASGLLFTVNAIRSESSVEYYPVITSFRYKFLPEYNGPVRYRGGVYKERRKVASAAGALFITDQNQGEREYVRYLHELATSLSNKFAQVYGSLEVFQ